MLKYLYLLKFLKTLTYFIYERNQISVQGSRKN